MKKCTRKNKIKCSKELKKSKTISMWMLSVFDFLREMNTFHVFVRFRVSLLCFDHIWIEGCPITIKNRTSKTRSDRRLSVNPKESDIHRPHLRYEKRSCCLSPRQQLLLVFNIHYLATPAVHSATRSGLASTKASAASSADSPS